MTSRELVIVHLLENLNELSDPVRSGSGFGSGNALLLMPVCYTRSVKELERLLRALRDSQEPVPFEPGGRLPARSVWWHTRAWYVDVDRVLFQPSLQRGRRRKPVKLQVDAFGRTLPQVVVRRQRGARRDIADRGVSWLAQEWVRANGLGWEPTVPRVRDVSGEWVAA